MRNFIETSKRILRSKLLPVVSKLGSKLAITVGSKVGSFIDSFIDSLKGAIIGAMNERMSATEFSRWDFTTHPKFRAFVVQATELFIRYRRQLAYALVVFVISDLTLLGIRGQIWPSRIPQIFRANFESVGGGEFALRSGSGQVPPNILNADGLIPEPLSSGDMVNQNLTFNEALATPTHFDLTLIATIVLNEPTQSVATFRLGTSKELSVFRIGSGVGDYATVIRIDRGKVFLRDNRTGRIEFAELPTELKLLFGSIYRRNNGVVSAKQGEFTVDRGKFDADTKDPAAFMALLQQARAVPVMGAGGGIEGFRMESLEAGSVFESLGLQVGDVIKQVNGQKLNGVSQASELFSALKDSNSIQLEIVRSGKPQSLKYTLR